MLRRFVILTIGALTLGVAVAVAPITAAVAEQTPGQAEPGDQAGSAVAAGDFDGDGVDDLATGAPADAIGTLAAAGAVTVTYGSGNGLGEAGGQLWSQDSAGIAETAEATDRFGLALAAGDFDGDGFDDLAVGAPYEHRAAADSGVVHVIYGSATGLVPTGSELFDQATTGIGGDPAAADLFGFRLMAGDFDSNGQDDLAIGVPTDTIGGVPGAGGVNVVYGTPGGLDPANSDYWNQAVGGIAGDPANVDNFGFALAAADFDGDTRDDLAIGVPDDDINGVIGAGAVHVLYGSAGGLTTTGADFWFQGSGLLDSPGTREGFGTSLAAANFGRSGHADLAVGVFAEDAGGNPENDAGAVAVIYGSSSGLSAVGDQLWQQGTGGLPDQPEDADFFGGSVAAANFGKSAEADLAVGSWGESQGNLAASGAVTMLYGSANGLSSTGSQFWTQSSPGIGGTSEAVDGLGFSVAAGNFGHAGQADLAVGVPFENVGDPDLADAGAVNVLYGTATGLTSTNNQLWTQGLP